MSKEKTKGMYNIKDMRPIVGGYETYEGTKSRIVAKYDLNVHTFDYWRKRVKRADMSNKQTTPFVELSATRASLSLSSEYYMLHFPDGKRLELGMSVP